ncbi:hypothetical protein [Cohnella mopanensis]|uniref:hypothetical protein n=1 Tax=Cohnella mopanensis TaxID=2911966 RepID=UPI001EF8478E|nr:hypothetical protein [Cohnella mopanensis]
MSQFLLDVSVNMYETIAMFGLMLAMFRISLRNYIPHTVIASIVMAQTSYLLRFVFHLDSITPLFMLLWFLVFIWMVYRIHFFYVLLIVVSGYLGYLIIQSAMLILLQIEFTMEEITRTLLHVKLIQIAGSTLTLGCAYWLLKKRIGFSFVPDRMDEKVEIKGINLLILIVSLIACLFISGVAYIFINVNFLFSTLWTVLLFILLIILNFSLRKEMKS